VTPNRSRIFLLSPANASGIRANFLLREGANFDLARRLREHGLPLGEAFAFMSGLYFRGKLAYSQAFAAPPAGISGSFVITSGYGLVPPEAVVTIHQLQELAAIPVDPAERRYREPLECACRRLYAGAGPECDFVLLGSVATPKYLEPMGAIFGERLLFPAEFIGRGDMSRGSLMLRSASARSELAYAPAPLTPAVVRLGHGPLPD